MVFCVKAYEKYLGQYPPFEIAALSSNRNAFAVISARELNTVLEQFVMKASSSGTAIPICIAYWGSSKASINFFYGTKGVRAINLSTF